MKTQYWHFCNYNRKTRFTNENIVEGETIWVKGKLKICENGMHWSKKPINAFRYFQSITCCLVKPKGKRILKKTGIEKGCSQGRKCLKILNVKEEILKTTKLTLRKFETTETKHLNDCLEMFEFGLISEDSIQVIYKNEMQYIYYNKMQYIYYNLLNNYTEGPLLAVFSYLKINPQVKFFNKTLNQLILKKFQETN